MDLSKEIFWITLWVLIYLHIIPEEQTVLPRVSMVRGFSNPLNVITDELPADSQTSHPHQESSQQIKLPQRGRSSTLPGAKNSRPVIFEGSGKASWNRNPMCPSSGLGAPSSQNDPYAGVWKWNELNSQRFFERNSNGPPPFGIESTDPKPIPLGPKYTRTRKRLELSQQLANIKRLPDPANMLSSGHTHFQHRPAPRSPRIAEEITNRDGNLGRHANDEYVGFIIPSDPNTLHPVQGNVITLQNLGVGNKKVEAVEHNLVAGKGQVIEPTHRKLAPKDNGSKSKKAFLPGPENSTSKKGGYNSGAHDEYMGFIIPSDPHTFHPVQKSGAMAQTSGKKDKKAQIPEADGKATMDRLREPTPSQPKTKANSFKPKKAPKKKANTPKH